MVSLDLRVSFRSTRNWNDCLTPRLGINSFKMQSEKKRKKYKGESGKWVGVIKFQNGKMCLPLRLIYSDTRNFWVSSMVQSTDGLINRWKSLLDCWQLTVMLMWSPLRENLKLSSLMQESLCVSTRGSVVKLKVINSDIGGVNQFRKSMSFSNLLCSTYKAAGIFKEIIGYMKTDKDLDHSSQRLQSCVSLLFSERD